MSDYSKILNMMLFSEAVKKSISGEVREVPMSYVKYVIKDITGFTFVMFPILYVNNDIGTVSISVSRRLGEVNVDSVLRSLGK